MDQGLVGVLDRLPEHGLTRELQRQRADASELKGSYQTLGSSAVRTERIFSEAAYDVQFTASSVPDTLRVHEAIVEFIPADLRFGGAFCHRVLARVLDTSNNPVTWIYVPAERMPTTDGTQKWRFHHASLGYPEDTIRLKFYFFTTGSGTFTATVIT